MNPRLRSTAGRCWCSSTAWKVPRAATTPKPSPTSPRERGLAYVVPHFRGCSGELNQAPRAYHSGDHEEIGWILARLRERHGGPLVAVGVSLGGNALMRWAGEAGDEAAQARRRGGRRSVRRWTWRRARVAIGRGFNRLVYTTMFLRSMKPKALRKLKQHPGLFDGEPADGGARPLRVRRHLHRAAARLSATPTTTTPAPRPSRTCTASAFPALALNALNDPFVPARQPAVARVRSGRT